MLAFRLTSLSNLEHGLGTRTNRSLTKLYITEENVQSHVANILSKLGANDRTHAVAIGLKRGIIEL
jgi:two-component system NarL family response regulator